MIQITRRNVLAGAAALAIPRAASAQSTDTIKMAVGAAQVITIDPMRLNQGIDNWAITNVHDLLARAPNGDFANTSADFMPELATAWEASADGKTWSFKLREGVQFHKGYGECTSEDVKFSFDRLRDPKSGSVYSAVFVNIAEVQTDGPYAVHFRLKQPDPFFLASSIDQIGAHIVCRKAVLERGDGYGRDPIGSGPYQVANVQTKVVSLVGNDKYFAGAPKVPKVEIQYILDTSARTLALLAGAADTILAPSGPGALPAIQARDPKLIADVVLPGNIWTLHFNLTRKPFDDLKVRQAFMYAIDRETIGKSQTPPTPKRWGMLPEPFPGALTAQTTPPELRYDYDPDKAKALLKEAGFPTGFAFSDFTSQRDDYLSLTLEVQEQLRQVGVNFDLKAIDHAAFHDPGHQGSGLVHHARHALSAGAGAAVPGGAGLGRRRHRDQGAELCALRHRRRWHRRPAGRDHGRGGPRRPESGAMPPGDGSARLDRPAGDPAMHHRLCLHPSSAAEAAIHGESGHRVLAPEWCDVIGVTAVLQDQPEIGQLEALVRAARGNTPALESLLVALIPSLAAGLADAPKPQFRRTPGTSYLSPPAIANSAAVWGNEAVFAVRSNSPPQIVLDGAAPQPLRRVSGSNIWCHLASIAIGETHTYTMLVDGRDLGTNSIAGYLPDSYPLPGAARGTLSDRRTITSTIYDGVEVDYWIYVNPGIDPAGAPLTIWLDGQGFVGALDLVNHRLQIVSDNLVHLGRLPPMVHLLVAPGTGGKSLPPRFPGGTQDNAVRGLQYDQVSDRYGCFVHQELLPEVEKAVALRQDAYSRAVAGSSSGAICAFNLAWYFEHSFSRVLSNIGSYVGLHWKPEQALDGGYIVAPKVRRDPKRNMRIWMATGMNDLEVDYDSERPDVHIAGSFPLANIQLANSLKLRGYDFHFRYGTATHSMAQGALDLPESLAWLWHGYDPGRTTCVFEQEAAERAKPIFRVAIANREAR